MNAIGHALANGSCWIAAPAGYGKTTAVRDYLRKSGAAHLWYRIDDADQDVATFFLGLGGLLRPTVARRLPVFGPEYAQQWSEFARRFFRAYFARLGKTRILVLDDVHDGLESAQFRAVLATLLRELPEGVGCACIGRALPPEELGELLQNGHVAVLDQTVLQFSAAEARALVARRMHRRTANVDVTVARGWAAGLVLIADRASATGFRDGVPTKDAADASRTAIFGALAQQLFAALTDEEQHALLRLGLLPEVTPALLQQTSSVAVARPLLARLHQRQLLVTRDDSAAGVYHLHDLLRDFLRRRLAEHYAPAALAALRVEAAGQLAAAGYADAAVDLALQAREWTLARALVVARADTLLAHGRRATLIEWCDGLPEHERDAWICYWLGVAHMADDAAAEAWLARAWDLFAARGELAGQCLTAARAVLSKSESWRTHEGLAAWTRRLTALIEREFPELSDGDELLVGAGMVRAVDFAPDFRSDAPAVRKLTGRLLDRLARRRGGDSTNLRMLASQALMDHAGATGDALVFERAVDSIADDLRSAEVAPWVLGVWLVTFGSVTSRYFSYAKRGFPYASSEQALRAAVAIGERECLRGVEFGALYHLQLLMKMLNDWAEFGTLIARISEIADSRYTTQVAVAADCEAAFHVRRRQFAHAHSACERFMAAIEAADEPPLERWPHYVTKFQLLLAEGRAAEAARFLEDLAGQFDGAVRQRTEICILAARAFEAHAAGASDVDARLRACLVALRRADWTAVLLNLPEHLATLCAAGLERDVEPDFCIALIRRRALAPPPSRPARWPWRLRIFVLGTFRLECDGEPVRTGPKAPTRSMDILRVLAIAKGHSCALQNVYDWLWPDADGDLARAACEQALHRLRRWLPVPDLVVQRDGKLQLAADRVWVDLSAWEQRVGTVANASEGCARSAFDEFGGPLLHLERATEWSLPAMERVGMLFVELACRVAHHHVARGDHAGARAVYQRALEMYPTSVRCYEGLIRGRLDARDEAGALDDYGRYLRTMRSARQPAPSVALRALVAPLLERRVSDS